MVKAGKPEFRALSVLDSLQPILDCLETPWRTPKALIALDIDGVAIPLPSNISPSTVYAF